MVAASQASPPLPSILKTTTTQYQFAVRSTEYTTHCYHRAIYLSKSDKKCPAAHITHDCLSRCRWLQGWLSMSNVAPDSPREAQTRVEWLPSPPSPPLFSFYDWDQTWDTTRLSTDLTFPVTNRGSQLSPEVTSLGQNCQAEQGSW